MMFVVFLLLALVLCACCLTWTRVKLWRNLAIVSLFGFISLGVYFALGYPQAYSLKFMMAQIDEDPASVDYDKVHSLLSQHLFWHPDDALAQTFEGRLYFATHEYPQAAQSFAKAYALLPGDPDILVEYATSLYLSGQSPDILAKLLRELIDHENMPYSAHSLLANIAMDQGETQLARTHWKALLRFIPKDSPEALEIKKLIDSTAVQ